MKNGLLHKYTRVVITEEHGPISGETVRGECKTDKNAAIALQALLYGEGAHESRERATDWRIGGKSAADWERAGT